MIWQRIKTRLTEFRDDTSGSFMVESVIALPLLFWTLCATFEFFEVHRYKSVREKATYTIADMISREQGVVTDIYVDNAKTLFDEIANDTGTNQIRISIIQFNGSNELYEIAWSEVRGSGSLLALSSADVANDHNKLPALEDGEQVILVESVSDYDSLFDLVLSDTINIETRVFTSIRFAPQICFDECSS